MLQRLKNLYIRFVTIIQDHFTQARATVQSAINKKALADIEHHSNYTLIHKTINNDAEPDIFQSVYQ